ASDAKHVVSVEGQLAEEPWIAARNGAVLTLLYGSGLRISEALGLSGADLSLPDETVLRVTGKGGKTRLVPV
ncbi:tyrosine-type recombinase/integrase, partial [Mesorhizobium sp.]